jgi:hypothetical protein
LIVTPAIRSNRGSRWSSFGSRIDRRAEKGKRKAAALRGEARVRFWGLLLSRRGAAHRAEEARIMR